MNAKLTGLGRRAALTCPNAPAHSPSGSGRNRANVCDRPPRPAKQRHHSGLAPLRNTSPARPPYPDLAARCPLRPHPFPACICPCAPAWHCDCLDLLGRLLDAAHKLEIASRQVPRAASHQCPCDTRYLKPAHPHHRATRSRLPPKQAALSRPAQARLTAPTSSGFHGGPIASPPPSAVRPSLSSLAGTLAATWATRRAKSRSPPPEAIRGGRVRRCPPRPRPPGPRLPPTSAQEVVCIARGAAEAADMTYPS